MESQSLLLSEPLYHQTDLCCKKKSHVQPAAADTSCGIQMPDPDSLKSRFRRLFCFDQAECEGVPLVCWGKLPSTLAESELRRDRRTGNE